MERSSISAQIAGYVASARRAAMTNDWELARSLAARALAFDLDNAEAQDMLDGLDRSTRPTWDAAERRQLTVLFCDLEGSVSLAERIDPEPMRDILMRYQELCHEITRRYGGYIAEYRGDGVIAYFGYPRANEGDARRAVQAGLEMALAIPTITFDIDDKNASLRSRIGIDTGLVVAGPVGAAAAPLPDAVTGLVPNLAARLEGLAGIGRVLVSDVTASLVEPYFELESHGPTPIKGISEPLEVFAIGAERAASDRRTALRYRVSPLVGRDAERDTLAHLWSTFIAPDADGDGAPSSHNASAAIVGPVGVGKTRLAWSLADLARQHGADVLEAECSTMQMGRHLSPIRQILTAALPIDRDASPDDQKRELIDALDALGVDHGHAPFIAELLALSPDVYPLPPLDSLEVHQRILVSIVALLVARAGRRPLLVLLEDLQWADGATAELVQRLLAGAHPRLFLAVTARDAAAIPAGIVHTIDLGPLDAASTTVLVRSVLGEDTDADDEVVHSIVERSGGVALFAVELARFHHLPRPAPTRLLGGSGTAMMPPAIADLVAGQLDGLGSGRVLAQAAAVVGREFSVSIALELTDLDAAGGADALARVLEADLVEDAGGGQYRFRHSLFQEVAYETLASSTRRQLHNTLADRLAASGSADPSLVAFHLARAGRVADAIVYHQIAAFTAQERVGAHAVALHELERSLELLDQLSPEEQAPLELTTRVLRGLSLVYTESYASPSAADDYHRALSLCEQMDYSPLIVPLTVAVWSYYTVSGDLLAAGSVVDGLLRLGSSADGEFFRPEIETCAAVQRFYEGRFDDAAIHFAAADAGFTARGDDAVSPVWKLPNDPVVATWSIGAANSWMIGDDSAGDRAIEHALARARSLPFPVGPFSECFALVGAMWLAELRRDQTASLAASASLIELASLHAYPFWAAVGGLRAGIATGRTGDAALAAEQVASAIELWHALGVKAYGPCNLANLAELQLAAGQVDHAAATIDEAVALAESTGERFFLAEALRIRGEIALAANRVDDAVASFTAAVALARQQGARRFQIRAALALSAAVPAPLRGPTWPDLVSDALTALADVQGPELDAARALMLGSARPELSRP